MGKKDKKDPTKQQAKKARQVLKQQKSDVKRNKKELKDAGEVDIESLIAEFSAKEASRVAVTMNVCAQPPRRANFTMTALPNGEMLLFGGEYCDGESSEVYNELYRWNVEKNEWKQIESLNTPPPRCSHQSVIYHDKLFMFGGEYATMDQFYHYRDFWELDLKTNVWTEVQATGDLPSARSGHRMVVWRNYLVLFGGFYEAMREVRWYNDLFLFSFQERKWYSVPYKPHAQVPKARSAVQMFLHSSDDILYIFGGYSKQKEGAKQEGKIHEDMWMLNLKPALPSGKSSNLEISKLSWQKITRKGDYPSPRCGAVVTSYKNKALVFGGVYDHEGPRHSMISTFYNDLYAFDMDRKRWYKLGLKQQKTKLTTAEKQEQRKAKLAKAANAKANNSDSDGSGDEDDDMDEDEDDDDDEEENIIIKNEKLREKQINSGELFGYIDESGTVVYVYLNDEDADDENTPEEMGSTSEIVEPEQVQCEVVEEAKEVDNLEASVAAVSIAKQEDDTEMDVEKEKLTPEGATQLVTSFFDEQLQPCSRINPCLMMRGNSLFIYGGVTELGDIEVTLDDCWNLDLNKRDQWKKVLAGSMHSIVWKGVDDDGENSSRHGSMMDEDDSDYDDDDSDDDDDDDSDDSEEEDNKKSKKKSGSRGAPSRRVEMDTLRSHFDTTDTHRTPLSGENLRDFYSRTAEFWAKEVISAWEVKHAEGSDKNDVLSEKEIKREGFLMAEKRYQELLPLLSRLNELEKEQEEEETHHNRKDSGRGRGHQNSRESSSNKKPSKGKGK